TLTGNSAANTLNGGTGADILQGAAGNDVYVVDNTGDKVIENISEGADKVLSYGTYAIAANVENLTLLGTLAANATGNTLANTLVGNVAANTLNGGIGADTLFGGTGDDTYIVDNTGDKAIEYTSAGIDIVLSYATYTLAANLENLTLLGTLATNATGNTLANTLIGNNANNTLNGGAGADKLQGGLGNDSYVVDNTGDKIIENAGEGIDTVQSYITCSLGVLGGNLENLTLLGTLAVNGTGNALNNTLTGNNAANILTDNLGNDVLNGGAGADTLRGGIGNDTYVVDNLNDKVQEYFGQGTDTVQSAISHTLAVNVENLALTGTAAINGTGNTLANVLTGNSAANSLSGGLGNDSLNGGAGDDTLYGEAGNDVLNGGTGIDTLIGGIGDDFYYIDTANDKVRENLTEGTDTVASPVTYTLGSNIERLTLTGTLALNGTGNTLANVLTGNGGDNVLDGGAGSDTLQGGNGNDIYKVDASTDKVVENAGAGVDTVQSSVTTVLSGNVENLTLTGSAAINGTGNGLDNTLIGNSANNTLIGGFGNDWLEGGAGKDTLQGGEDTDTFVLSGGDTVMDCQSGIDHIKIRVSNGQMDPPVGNDDNVIDDNLYYRSDDDTWWDGDYYNFEGDPDYSRYGDELVIITTNITGQITDETAAAVMPLDYLGVGFWASRIYVVDNGQDTAIYKFDSKLDYWEDDEGGYRYNGC
ncbi:calcium-binding protein, partial [Methylovulum sp.]|uniref:calcium-binding protein n=1 Tax=Methylovulum sp. TaxID=1916980 RepID=UPI0026210968